jgi:hypothetical protein
MTDTTTHEDAELLALGEQIDALIEEFEESTAAWARPGVKDALDRLRRISPNIHEWGEAERAELGRMEREASGGARHMDDVIGDLSGLLLRVAATPALSDAGIAVKARLVLQAVTDFCNDDIRGDVDARLDDILHLFADGELPAEGDDDGAPSEAAPEDRP